MLKGKKGAIWSWNFNYGMPYPMPCDKCGALVEMKMITSGNPSKLVKCPECGYIKKKSD